MKSNTTKRIQTDFNFLKEKLNRGELHSVLVYGSYATGEETIRSDIDICIVAPKANTIKQQARLLKFIWQNINSNKYDVRLFEALPLYIKMEVINNNKIVLTKDKYDLSYYFYFFRKLWQDQSVNWMEK